MRLVILGSTGGVGRHLVRQALDRGHTVVAVARPGSEVDPEAQIARLDVSTDPLQPILDGADAVLSALGMRRAQVWNPWSRVLCAHDFCSASARRVVEAMALAGVQRIVAVSAAGVGDSAAAMNPIMRALVASSSIGVAYRDLAVMESVYIDGVAEALLVRPVTLSDGPVGPTREVDHFGSLMAIPRASVAAWMLDAVEAAIMASGRPQIAAR